MKVINSLVLILVLMMNGCSNLSKSEKLWLGGMIAANSFGNNTLNESNKESDILLKVGIITAFYGIGELFPEHRTYVYQIGTTWGVGTIIYDISDWDHSNYINPKPTSYYYPELVIGKELKL